MRKFLKWGAIVIVLLAIVGALASPDEKKKDDSPAAHAAVAGAPVAQTKDAGKDETPTPEPPPAPKPDGKYELRCDYVLGDFGESGDPKKGFRFIGGGTLTNTGNVGIRVRVTFRWRQLGAAAVKTSKTYKVNRGKDREINATVAASQDQVDLHQSADAKCTSKATIVGSFGTPKD